MIHTRSAISQNLYIDDMALWPNVEYSNIFLYFIERPDVYTKTQIVQYKSLQAYNYFFSKNFGMGAAKSNETR